MRRNSTFVILACFFMFIPCGVAAQHRSNQARTRQKSSQPKQIGNQRQRLKSDLVLGGWNAILRLSWGECAFKLFLDKSADPLSGYIVGDGAPCPLTEVTQSGNDFRGVVNPKKCKLALINLQDRKMSVDLTSSERDVITGTATNDKIVGEYESDGAIHRWEAKRIDISIPIVDSLTPYKAPGQGRASQQQKPADEANTFLKPSTIDCLERYNKNTDRLNPILDAILERKGIGKGSDPSKFVGIFLGVRNFSCHCKVFWKGDEIKELIVSKLAGRIRLIPDTAEQEWISAIRRLDGQTNAGANSIAGVISINLNETAVLGFLTLQDKLFAEDSFKQDEFKKVLKRLESVQTQHIDEWARALDIDKIPAIVSLINVDSIFVNDEIQPGLFEKKVKNTAQRK
jgi:hypothetical protein